MTPELDWTEGGPRSRVYDDVYFSRTDGLAESRAVFLQGCGLPDAWLERDHFCVAELGFGTGLNIVALLDLWRDTGPADAQLSIFSVEAHPLSREDAARALHGWRSQAPVEIDALLDVWPDARRGFHRIDLAACHATLNLYIGEVGEALSRWSGLADAWFLDGFAPAKNPAMWSDPVLAAIGRLSAPGARAATFTVAGQVRRGLTQAGFVVEKRPGFGDKRERLEARRPGVLSSSTHPHHRPVHTVAVIGGGIAGAALVRAFDRQGVVCTLIEAVRPGSGASGNPAALVTPRLDAGFGPPAELHAQAFAYAVGLYRQETPQASISTGALQLGGMGKDSGRFAKLAAWDGFAPDDLQTLPADEASSRLDEADALIGDALLIAEALVVEPAVILQTWLASARQVSGLIAGLGQDGDRWLCLDAAGRILVEADAVCIAAGFDTAALLPGAGLLPVRGQVEFTSALDFTGQAAAWGGYAIPLRRGVLYGASHVRGDPARDLRSQEAAANLAMLQTHRPALAARIEGAPKAERQSRASVRAATPDHLPLAGETSRSGLSVLAALGGRGFTLAPLLAEHVAAVALRRPSPLSADLAHRLRPDRFAAENPHAPKPLF